MRLGASTVGFSCVFLRDVVTLRVKSVFLLLLIENEGLHRWLFLSDVANPFSGRVVVFNRPPLASRIFLWLVAALLPSLSLIFASGLSSPGLSCCLAMSLRYVALLSCGGAPTVCLAKGLVAFFPVLRSPAGSGWAGSCAFYSPIWFSTFAMGSPLRGRGCFHPQSEQRLGVFLFPFWAVLRVATALRDLVTIRVRLLVGSHLSTSSGCQWCFALSPSGGASSLCLRFFFAPCSCRCTYWWSSLRPRVFESSGISPGFFSFWGPAPVSRLFLSLRPRRSRSLIPSLAPSWWSPCPLLWWALRTLSCYVLSVSSASSLLRSRLSFPFAMSPLSHRVFAEGIHPLREVALEGGVSPCVGLCRTPWG